MTKPTAILFLGPTGSGKTPLGEYVARKGLLGRRCFHFDFGAELRRIAEHGTRPQELTKRDLGYISRVLESGALLENETFYIAEQILRFFIERNSVKDEDIVLLNGLPRHVGQADDIGSIVNVNHVLYLECVPAVVEQRIRTNSGGDRYGRTDDSLEAIAAKLAVFVERTLPLLEYYREREVRVHTVTIEVETELEELYKSLVTNYQ